MPTTGAGDGTRPRGEFHHRVVMCRVCVSCKITRLRVASLRERGFATQPQPCREPQLMSQEIDYIEMVFEKRLVKWFVYSVFQKTMNFEFVVDDQI